MALPIGEYFIDGKDLWTIFGIFVKSGSDDFIKFPARKPTTTHDWGDSNGIDVDLSRVFFEENKISLQCIMVADNKEDFWIQRNAFLAEWAKPGTRDLQITKLSRTFKVFYKDCTNLDTFRTIRVNGESKVACEFTLNLIEQEPQLGENGNLQVFIVDEAGRFFVT